MMTRRDSRRGGVRRRCGRLQYWRREAPPARYGGRGREGMCRRCKEDGQQEGREEDVEEEENVVEVVEVHHDQDVVIEVDATEDGLRRNKNV